MIFRFYENKLEEMFNGTWGCEEVPDSPEDPDHVEHYPEEYEEYEGHV
ncbi:MAG: hypothetical protein ACRC6D_01360 [Aeromonas sp.]